MYEYKSLVFTGFYGKRPKMYSVIILLYSVKKFDSDRWERTLGTITKRLFN